MTRDIEELSLAKLPKSTKILERAKKVLLSPTVTGPFRNPKAVAFIKVAKGGKVIDHDGNEYVDVTMAYGPMILGHDNPIASDAAKKALKNGSVLAIANESEVRLAELMVEAIPCAERVAFCNTGTEATMHAMRVARAVSGKDKIAKFEGGYHGVHDSALVSGLLSMPEGSSEDPASVADNLGTPQSVVDQMITLTYKHPASLDKIREYKDELAAVIIEPVPSAYPVDMKDYLTELRAVTKECGVILIFDEVISGFRLGYGGAQEYFGITPDMATYGKIIGGGFPAGAIAGSVEVLQPLITSGDPLQDMQEKLLAIGTFSGNPVTTTVGAAVLEHLRDHPEIYKHIDGLADRIKKEIHDFAKENEFEFQLMGLGSWFIPHFVWGDIEDPRALRGLDNLMKGEALGHYMRYHGVYMPDMHLVFMCSEHTDEDADKIIDAFKKSLLDMKEDGML